MRREIMQKSLLNYVSYRTFGRVLAAILAINLTLLGGAIKIRAEDRHNQPSKDLLTELKSYPHKIVYESNRDGNWELYLVNADGSDPVNLTRTPDVDELYPKP